jgi:RNA polymerase sigma factor for flagellar operon FliA
MNPIHHGDERNHIESVWQQWKTTGDSEFKKELIEYYINLVDIVANRLSAGLPRSVNKQELVSHGIVGLIDAIEKFSIDRGLQFETYASWRIRGSIIDGMRQTDWVPRSVRDKARKIEDAYQKLEQKFLRSVTDAEMSEYLQVSEIEFQQMLQDISFASVCSLEDPIRDEESETRLSLLIDDKAKNPEDTVDELALKDSLSKGIEQLTDKERTVISLFYYEELTVSEIAEVMNVSPSRVSQLHSKAIIRLRGSLGRMKEELI